MRLLSIYEDVTGANATRIGRIVQKVTDTEAAYEILDTDPKTSGGTFNQGACANLAYALQLLVPGSEVWGIRRNGGNGIVDHVVLKIGNNFVDSNGSFTEAELLDTWSSEISDPIVVPIKKQDLGEIPYSQWSIDQYKELFKSVLYN